MTCDHIRTNLFRYTEQSMPADERSSFEEHLRGCEGCSAAVEGFTALEALMRKEKEAEPNPFAATRILQRLESETEQRAYRNNRRLVHMLQPALVTASLMIALLAGYLLGRNSGMIQNQASAGNQREQIRSELYINDFVDEDQSLLSNK